MKKINFVFGIHSHQPVGNFDFVFDDAFKKAYQPFLNIIEKYPDFRINIHYSGILLEWIEKHYPDHIEQLARMSEKGQIEILSGGFYEPIVSIIPREDALGQIRKLSAWVQSRFRQTPSGMWLAERVWEPHLPSLLKDAGVSYTVIDDTHFKYAGLEEEELWGYYATEDQGKILYIFPISQKLRYTIPFQDPEVTLEFFREIATEEGDRLIVFADDGEKFGVWPGTYPHVYENGWLEKFIQVILENRDWINLLHFSEALQKVNPLGRAYLPTASYAEMMQWALPSRAYKNYEDFEHLLKDRGLFDKYNVFVRGGFWRNFLSKYPESNNMHKKMLYLSEQLWELAEEKGFEAVQPAFDALWAGQCNCPYWHGVFGGLYLGHIRHAMYEEFIKAEKILRELKGTSDQSRIQTLDFDKDGVKEILVETPHLNLYFDPQHGGHLFELDYLPKNFNLLNTMTRREEGYHRKLVEFAESQKNQEHSAQSGEAVASIHDLVVTKEVGLEKYLIYDKYERKALIDHIFPLELTLQDFATTDYQEMGNFVNQPYEVESYKVEDDVASLVFSRVGRIKQDENRVAVKLTKKIRVSTKDARMEVEYILEPLTDTTLSFKFAVEFNFSLLAGDAPDRYYYSKNTEIHPNRLKSQGELHNANHLGLVDEYNGFKIDLESNKPGDIWHLPVETVSLSEAGFERVYQNSSILFIFPIELNKKWQVKILKNIQNLLS